MFVYLSKKIAIPNNTQLHCVSWNKKHGYIACGGEDGLLKVLKLESGNVTGVATGVAALSNLSMNQTLEGHSSAVKVVTWNEGSQQKLTSSDQFGLIIVWMLYKGSWYEEMINNRNKSVVRDMKWNADGQKICIVYEDGAVIVGSVDGNRIWGRELKAMALTNVEWSPDGRLLLFGVQNGDIFVFDNSGNHVGQVVIKCLNSFSGLVSIVGIEWYNGKGGFSEPNSPRLVICFSNGRLQIMQNESDTDPVLLDAGDIRVVSIQWNNNGNILALAGIARFEEGAINKECNVVQFYTPHGDHLRTLKVPGKQIVDCSWDGCGLRLALAIDHFIYFANIRPNYKWCYFSNTVVYAFTKPDRSDVCVSFWDTKNNEHCIKYVKQLVAIAAGNEYCVLSTKSEDDNEQQYALVICNAIGTPVDSKYVDLTPTFLSMSSGLIIAASQNQVLIWSFSTPQSKSILNFVGTSISDDDTDRLYHVDDIVSNKVNEIAHFKEMTDDPICCVCHTETTALVARESGIVYQCSLPNFTWVCSHNLCCQPYHIVINCNSTRACVLDSAGLVMLLELENHKTLSTDKEYSAIRQLERKDVWDIKWSIDNSELFVLMEKTRMYVFRNTEPEEPTSCSGYICSFENLQVKTVLLDDIMGNPDNPSPQMMVDMEVKSLRDTRELLDKVSIGDAMTFVEDNPHPRLWRLLAEAALEKMNLKVAETAFVKCKDLHAIRFVKSLHNVQSEMLRKAEVAAYCHKFDEAEKLYLENDRRDLAVSLRRKLGDWFRVVQLLKSGSTAGNDALLEEAWNAIGDYFADRQKWESAVKYYEQGSNQDRLAECYYALEDYANLETLANGLPEGNKLLSEIAGMFATLGMCEQAVSIYIKNGNTKAAIDCCISLHNWSKAVELAERYKIREIEPLLAKYSQHLLDKNKVLSAVELYRKAGGFIEATQLLSKIAKDGGKKKETPLHLKKLYVLAGMLVDEHRRSRTRSSNKQVTSMISGLLAEESLAASISGEKTMDSAWQGAEAYHFYLLAQRQLYDGYFEAAMKTALHLQDYENILDQEEIYVLLALASSANRAFGTCSKAFIKLESLEDVPVERREIYENIAMDIFVKNSPRDILSNQVECPTCSGMMPDWCNLCPSCNSKYPLCTATGRPLLEPEVRWTCHRCKRCAGLQELTSRKTCPLCHVAIS